MQSLARSSISASQTCKSALSQASTSVRSQCTNTVNSPSQTRSLSSSSIGHAVASTGQRQNQLCLHRFRAANPPTHTHRNNTHGQSRHLSSTSPRSFIPVPYVQFMEGGQNHTTDLFSKLLKERVVCCYGQIEDRMAATITASLLYLESESDAPISMYINSPGGSVSSGLSIYDTMNYITAPVSTIVLGSAMSMGSLLACAGAEGKRYILPHATVMLHQPSGGASGMSADIQIHAKEILRLRDQLNGIYKRHMNQESVVKRRGSVLELEEIEKLLDRDYFLSAEDAVRLGIVDEVLMSRKKVDEAT